MKKIKIAIIAGLLFFCTPVNSAKKFLAFGTVTGWATIEVIIPKGIITSTTSPSPPQKEYRDSHGDVWIIEKKVKKIEKMIAVPDGTVDMAINNSIIYCLAQDHFEKINLATGVKIPFLKEKFLMGSETIKEFLDSSEKIAEPILSWGVDKDKIFVLTSNGNIFLFDARSGERERTLFYKEGVTGMAVEDEKIYVSSLNQISCYLESGQLQWDWTNRLISNFEPKKIEIKNGVLYAISNNQVFRILIGRVDKNKEVRNSSVISASKNSNNNIIDLATNGNMVTILDDKDEIKIYDSKLDFLRYHFTVESTKAIALDGNRLYVLVNNNIIRIFELY